MSGVRFTGGTVMVALVAGGTKHVSYGDELGSDIDPVYITNLTKSGFTKPLDEELPEPGASTLDGSREWVDDPADDEPDHNPLGDLPAHEELVAQLERETPNKDWTLQLAAEDPVRAQCVLDAELARSDAEPRKGVVKALEAIIESADA